MTRLVAISILALTVIAGNNAAGIAETRNSQAAPALIGTLDSAELTGMPRVCECEFYRGPVEQQSRVFETRKERTHGFVKIKGNLVALQLATRSGHQDCRPNTRYTERWTAGSTTVVLNLRVTKPGAEACWYKGRMSVATGNRTETVVVTGACGC
jgi:hypothetical protein